MTEAARVRVTDRVAEIAKSDWQGLAAGHPSLRHEVLELLSDCLNRPRSLRFFLLEDASGLTAAAVCEVVLEARVPSPLDASLFGRGARLARALGVPTVPLLLFESPLSSTPTVLARAGEDRSGRLVSLLSAVERYALARGFTVAFANIPARDPELSGAFEHRGYLACEMPAVARLEVKWPDFDGYVQYLRQRSKNAATNARRERQRNERSGTRIRRLPPGEPATPLYELARAHYLRKNHRELPDAPTLLPRLQQSIGEDLICFVAERDGRRTASVAVVRFGGSGWVYWLGFADAQRPNDFTYPNLLYYQLAGESGRLGIDTLFYGTDVLRAKLLRGCSIDAHRLFLKPRSASARLLLRPYLALLDRWRRRRQSGTAK